MAKTRQSFKPAPKKKTVKRTAVSKKKAVTNKRRAPTKRKQAVPQKPSEKKTTPPASRNPPEVDEEMTVIDHETSLRQTISRTERLQRTAPLPSCSNQSRDDDDFITAEDYPNHVWHLADSYFENNNKHLQSHAISSFNRFIGETMPKTMITCGKVSVENVHNELSKSVHTLEITSVYIERQVVQESFDGRVHPLYPQEARDRELTYSSPVYADFRYSVTHKDAGGFEQPRQPPQTFQRIKIADIPIMVKSDYCRLHGKTDAEIASRNEDPDDSGGYFIINGREKFILTQERPANNKLFVFKPMCDSKYQFECELRSVDYKSERVAALWIHIPGNPKSYQTFKDAKRCHVPLLRKKNQQPQSEQQVARKKQALNNKLKKQYVKTRPAFLVSMACLRGTIPLMILFKALGFDKDGEIYETFMASQGDSDFQAALWSTMQNAEYLALANAEEALYYIGRLSLRESPANRTEVISQGREVINREVLPGLGTTEEFDSLKGYHIGYMVNRLVFAYLGRIPCDDRDHLQNKRFDHAGAMLSNLIKNQVRSLMNETRLALWRRISRNVAVDIERNIIRRNLLTRGINYAMSTGNWGDRRYSSTGRVGVCQPLNRLTRVATLSFLRRLASPCSKLVRMTPPRMVHTTAFGYICPSDTPEGENVGLLKALSLTADISTEAETRPIVECLKRAGYHPIDEFPQKLCTDTKIFIDADINGTCPGEKAMAIVESLRRCRQQFNELEETKRKLEQLKDPKLVSTYHGFSNQVSVLYEPEYKEIRIRTDAGRAYRPLLVVRDNKLLLRRSHMRRLLDTDDPYSWNNLINDGVIEYLDAAESESAMIAMTPGDLDGSSGRNSVYVSVSSSYPFPGKVSYTHCELHPSMILGVCAALIPFPDHNQSPKNASQTGMAKQALGVYQTNFFHRWDPESHVLHYPQRPLVTTKAAKYINYDSNPAGVNVVAAICCYSGYNQEDSVILNKSAINRGLFRSTMYRVKTDEAMNNVKHGETDEEFEIPVRHEVLTFKNPYYKDLEHDGLPPPGILIEDNYPLIGKTKLIEKQLRTPGAPIKIDASFIHRSSHASPASVVDAVMVANNAEGYRMARVRLRNERVPQIGDKFASRHGQKGVVGMDFHETDLPFTKDGIVPDLILNPHAIPSRMTIGHLLETVAAKASALSGTISDGTCFTKRPSVEEVGDELEKLGYHKHGMEVMYNGATGCKMQSQIFIGPVYYQKLRHMVEDKLHVRSRGPMTILCRQPLAGLHKDGGLRFGEMEKDATIAHGAASFLREKMFFLSDFYGVPICANCGSMLTKKSRFNGGPVAYLKCKLCKETTTGASTVALPYACKLLFQELMSMNVRVRLETVEDSRGLKAADNISANVTTDTPPNLMDKIKGKMHNV